MISNAHAIIEQWIRQLGACLSESMQRQWDRNDPRPASGPRCG